VRNVILHIEDVAKSANRIADLDDLCTPRRSLDTRFCLRIAILAGYSALFGVDVRPIRQSLYAFILLRRNKPRR